MSAKRKSVSRLNSKKITKLLLIFWLMAFLVLPGPTLAIGTTPSVIEVNDLRKENKVARTVYLTMSASQEESYYSVSTSGDGARYLELPATAITVPKNSINYAYTFYITPTSAANNTYSATIFFVPKAASAASTNTKNKTVKSNSVGASVSLVTGATANVVFTVTDKEIKKLAIQNVSISDTEVGLPLVLSFVEDNGGNVDTRPDKVAIELVDTTDLKLKYKEEIKAENIALAGVASRKPIDLALTTKLPQGKYTASTTFWFDNKLLYQKSNLIFNVYPAGTLAQTAGFTSFDINAEKFSVGDLVKFTSQIKNTGKAVIKPIFYVEIKKDNKILDLLKSEEKTLFKGADSEYTITYRPQDNGQYTADGYFEYGIHKTEYQTKNFVVGALATNKIIYLYVLLGGLLCLAAVATVWIIRRKKTKKSEKKK